MPNLNPGPSSSASTNTWSSAAGVTAMSFSRNLTPADNGAVIEVDANVTFTVRSDLPDGFACAFLPLSGVTVTLASDGTSTLNGATTSLTRAQSSNVMFALQQFRSTRTAYAVTGS